MVEVIDEEKIKGGGRRRNSAAHTYQHEMPGNPETLLTTISSNQWIY